MEQISKELIGLYLFHESDDGLTVGRIVETEVYNGRADRACHAFHKTTKRTEVMYEMGGRAYVYLCYGIHYLFNILTNIDGMADAILIKVLESVEGIEIMRSRTNKKPFDRRLASGPGLVGKAMSFSTKQTCDLLDGKIWIGKNVKDVIPKIVSLKRIGVDYAGDDANL